MIRFDSILYVRDSIMSVNVLGISEVGDLVSQNLRLIIDHKSTKQCVKSRPKFQFLQTLLGVVFLLSYIFY